MLYLSFFYYAVSSQHFYGVVNLRKKRVKGRKGCFGSDFPSHYDLLGGMMIKHFLPFIPAF